MLCLSQFTYYAKNVPQSILSLIIFINLFLQNQICPHTLAQTEISRSFFTPFNSDDNWKSYQTMSSNHITDCGTSLIFGGPSVFNHQTAITKTFILPPHYKLQFDFKFWRLDPWSGSFYIFFIDGYQAYKDGPNTSTGTQICGSGTVGQVYSISDTISHNGNSAIITIISLQVTASWGISDFVLFVYKCPKGCDYCDISGNCQNWNRMLIFFNKIVLTDGEGWKSDYALFNGIQECGSFHYYGKFQMSKILQIVLYLSDPHTKVRMQFKFLCAFVTGSIVMRSEANGVEIYNAILSVPKITNNDIICGPQFRLDKIFLGEIVNSDQTLTLTIQIVESPDPADSTHFFGIRDFEVFTDAEKQVFNEEIICNDDNIYAFDGCFSQIYDCNEGCNQCIKGLCTQCLSHWTLNTISGQCKAKCGDQIVVSGEQCDDGNQQPYDGCYECQFSCPLNCNICQFGNCLNCNPSYQLIGNQCKFICFQNESENLSYYSTQKEEGYYCQISNFISNIYMQHVLIQTELQPLYDINQCSIINYGIFAYQYQLCPFEQPQNCKISFQNQCQICDDLFELSQNLLCIPICGNGVTQEYESCDDANLQMFDGCYQCQSSCQLECLECNSSQCFKCMEGWNLVNFKCFSECGDGIIALLQYEQCDDQNNEKNDGCFECKFECSQNCQFCNQNLGCFQCQKYFELQNKVCTPLCGDGIVIEGFEQCDDGNDIEYDGCHQCQFSCKENCQICDQQNCMDIQIQQCEEDGYYLIDSQCLTICGDLIIASNEQCDDDNEIPFDGCYQCQFSCPLNCYDCDNGQCLQCDDGYQIKNNLCIGICGDGSKQEIEECDDFNQISHDGCSDNCEIEINWACTQINFQTSQCVETKPPHFNLLFINQTYDSQFIQLQITSKVKLQNSYQNLTKNLKTFLVDVNPLYYMIYSQVVVEPNATFLQDINYLFQIKLLKQVTTEIYFQVQLDTLLIDDFGFQVENQFCKLRLKNPIVLSEQQRIVSHKMSQLNMYILIGLGVASFFILLSGNPVECFEVLDTMQYQANLKYINSNFPENVMIYFESSEVVTIRPILEKLKLLNFFDGVIGQDYMPAFGKFLFYDVNSDLITNISGLIVQVFMALLFFVISKIYLKILFNNFYNQFRAFIYNNQKSFLPQKLAFLIHKLNQLSFGIYQMISIKGIIYLIKANSWDLLFKTLLYLFSEKESNLRNRLSNMLAYSFLISILILISSIFSIKDSQMELKKRKHYSHEGLIVAKKFLFVLVLIEAQKSQLTQSILLSLINSSYITIIVLGKMVNEKI
ncbi:unnamed protein product (macronuclear) [Paramecium tetraurelia]|uniref:TNFR-Cys domain-containing protein n=1 Tax=Paramecium tetraurelia TaxID=5888 RepID=A0EBD0_PARTE|nr:uncharacterized protein GSPATT00025331001 [Paramecium tetraurelia]CAK92597.1 unnamed protein product [Paramecium tetraurelia]|eukprot:XP_001459994.1 hypothetical protein (macronuclear) [Paramecium tetraurelia strain d4-2]